MKALDKLPVATILTAVLVAIAAGVGGAVVILGNMSFHDYLEELKWFAGAVGLLAVGRGLLRSRPGAEATATVNVPKPSPPIYSGTGTASSGGNVTLTPLAAAPKAKKKSAPKKKPRP